MQNFSLQTRHAQNQTGGDGEMLYSIGIVAVQVIMWKEEKKNSAPWRNI